MLGNSINTGKTYNLSVKPRFYRLLLVNVPNFVYQLILLIFRIGLQNYMINFRIYS